MHTAAGAPAAGEVVPLLAEGPEGPSLPLEIHTREARMMTIRMATTTGLVTQKTDPVPSQATI